MVKGHQDRAELLDKDRVAHQARGQVEHRADSQADSREDREWAREGSSKTQQILTLRSADRVDKFNHLRKPRLDEQVDAVARAFY